jgi:hypothetical protein
MQGTRARKAVRAQDRSIASSRSCLESGWGKGTAVAAWKVGRGWGPYKGRTLVTATEGPSTLSNEVKERFPWPAQSQAVLPVHNKVEVQLNRLPCKSVHIAGYRRFGCPRRQHSSLYKVRIGTTVFHLDSWPLKKGPLGSPKRRLKNYHSLRNDPQKRSSPNTSHCRHSFQWSQDTEYLHSQFSYCRAKLATPRALGKH